MLSPLDDNAATEVRKNCRCANATTAHKVDESIINKQCTAVTKMLLPVIVLAVICYALYDQLYGRRRRYPPGPMPLPLVGNVLSIDEKDPAPAVNKVADDNGGIGTFWMGSDPQVVITDFDMIREALVTNGWIM